MRILLTGGLGGIGTPMAADFRKRGHIVIVTDLLAGYNDFYHRMDVAEPEDVDEVLQEEKPDLVIHMGAEVGRLNGELHPLKILRSNVIGTMNVARTCARLGIRLISFSTSEVYGENMRGDKRLTEDMTLNAFGTTNIYAASKLFAEAIVKHYVDDYDLKAIIVRPFMVVSESVYPSKYRAALVNFVHGALTNTPFPVFRGTLRAWCYVGDFIDGVALLLDHIPVGMEIFNIGSEEYTPTEEVAKWVIKLTGADPELVQLQDPPAHFNDPIKVADCSKIRALGFKPRVTLDKIIARIVAWQKENVNA